MFNLKPLLAREHHESALREPYSGLLGMLGCFKVLDHREDFTNINAPWINHRKLLLSQDDRAQSTVGHNMSNTLNWSFCCILCDITTLELQTTRNLQQLVSHQVSLYKNTFLFSIRESLEWNPLDLLWVNETSNSNYRCLSKIRLLSPMLSHVWCTGLCSAH